MPTELIMLPPTSPASKKKKKRRKSKASSNKPAQDDETASPSRSNDLPKVELEVDAAETDIDAKPKIAEVIPVSEKKKKKKRRKSSSESQSTPAIVQEGDKGGDDKPIDMELDMMVGSTTEGSVSVERKELEALPDANSGDNKDQESKKDGDEGGDNIDDNESTVESDTTTDIDQTNTKKSNKLTKEGRASLKLKKKEAKQKLLSQVPKVDKDGISYTKIQIRRMLRRVKAGLHAVPTEKEENERRRLIKLEKMEEEEELAGMLHQKDEDQDDADQDDADQDDADQDDADQDDAGLDEFGRKRKDREEGDADGAAIEEQDAGRKDGSNSSLFPPVKINGTCVKVPLKKKRRVKAVPEDYVCSACKNQYSPPHWIYDCPYKIRKPGSGQVAKKFRGINDPVSRKVFVSGLPFDVKAKDVEAYFESAVMGGKVMHCKLFLFDDTKRCKGQGIVTFGTDESARKALKLNGTVLESGTFNEKKKKKGSKENTEEKKKELRLGVSKMLNRTITKGKRGPSKI